MKRKLQIEKHCFIEGARPCTLKCKAAYKSGREVYCGILWTLKNMGYMADVVEEKIKQETPKKSKK